MGCQHANADKHTGNAQDGRSLTFPEVPSPLDDKLPTAEPCKLYPGCETPAVLTVEWIYTHSSRAKGDDLWKINTGGKFSNWSVRCHWVDVIFFFFHFLVFFLYLTTPESVLLEGFSHAGQKDEMRLALCCVFCPTDLYILNFYTAFYQVFTHRSFGFLFFLLSWVKWDLQGNKW